MHLQDNSLQDHLWGKRGQSNGFVTRTPHLSQPRWDCTAALLTQVPILMFYVWCHACSGFQWLNHSFSVIQSLPSKPFYNATSLFDYSKSTLIIICSFLQDFDPLTVKRTNMVVQPLQRLQRHRKGGMNTTGNDSRGGRSKEKHLRFQKAHVRHIKWKKWLVLTGLMLSFTSLQSLLWLLPSPRRGVK